MPEFTDAIFWGDGTSDKLYLTYSGDVGSNQLIVASDSNMTLSERQQMLNFKTQGGQQLAVLTVAQQARSRAFSAGFDSGFK
jgi:hypothetical protein